MDTFSDIKRKLSRIASAHGKLTEADCVRVLRGIHDPVLIARISNWLFKESGIAIQGLTPQYQQEVMQKVKNPNVENVKDTKHRTHKNKNKYQKSKKHCELEATLNLNKAIEKLKDVETEFLPSWDKDKVFKQLGQQFDIRYPEQIKYMIRDLLSRHADSIPQNALIPELLSEFERLDPGGTLSIVQKIDTAIDQTDDMDKLMGVLNRLTYGLQGEFETVEPNEPDSTPRIDWRKEPEQEFSLEDDIYPPIELGGSRKAALAFDTIIMFENGAKFETTVARTPLQKAAGLEVVEALPSTKGMLFPFRDGSSVTFHMGSVQFPIDILFLRRVGSGKLVIDSYVDNAKPGNDDYWSASDVSVVLEVAGGQRVRQGLDRGITCVIL